MVRVRVRVRVRFRVRVRVRVRVSDGQELVSTVRVRVRVGVRVEARVGGRRVSVRATVGCGLGLVCGGGVWVQRRLALAPLNCTSVTCECGCQLGL